MKRFIVRRASTQRGQGMSEYIIITALIAIAAIGVFTLFGGTIQSQTASMAQEMAGESGVEAQQQAADFAQEAQDEASEKKDLGNYQGQNESAGGS